MRPGSMLLLVMLCLPVRLMAEETTAPQLAEPSVAVPVVDASATPGAAADADEALRHAAQLQRVRQENQRLKLQLKDAQANSPLPLISEEQTWFAIGAAAALLGVLAGALLRGGRGTRREWLN
jgi:SH3 domain protein